MLTTKFSAEAPPKLTSLAAAPGRAQHPGHEVQEAPGKSENKPLQLLHAGSAENPLRPREGEREEFSAPRNRR